MPNPRPIAVFLLYLPLALAGANSRNPDAWIPVRWPGGPLETAVRAKAGTLPADAAAREAIDSWYDSATLGLLDGSPLNCLLLTWSAGADPELERRQQALVKAYANEAHKREFVVLGLVYAGADIDKAARAAASAQLDGLVLDGKFPGSRTADGIAVISIAPDAPAARAVSGPLVAVEGVAPGSKNLAEMGMRSAPSSEPWIQSNIWLVRALRNSPRRPVWISQQPESGSAEEYARSVADAAVGGGRWIVSLDDALRAGLRRHDPGALATWRRIAGLLAFAEQHADWRAFEPYGNLAIVEDPASASPEVSDEYLNLVARRQVPYRRMARAQLGAASLAAFQAVIATDLAPPSAAEREVLRAFAERGGLVVAGPSWGNPPKDQPYAEVAVGKGRVAVYKDPDPESVARDLKDLLSHEAMGMVTFNVPSVITYASTGDGGKRLLVQLLNYSKWPAEAITIRVAGTYKTARMYMPDTAPADLPVTVEAGKTEVSIAKLPLWGGLLLE